MSAAEWLGIGLLCFAVGQLAERSRRHHRRHRMRLVSWRWDQIAAYQRKQSKLAKMGLRLAKPLGELAMPFMVLGVGALLAAGFVLLS